METLIMRQYKALKREAPEGSILLFKMGDFWEAFGEDAVRLSPIFGTPLTKRGNVLVAGCPKWEVEERMGSIYASGAVFALAEAVENCKRGISRREIVRIIHGGTGETEQ